MSKGSKVGDWPEYKDNHIDDRVKEVETGVPIDEARAGQRALFEWKQ